jgi:hypothetical protein
MSKLFVGQRVRVVALAGANPIYNHMNGKEGVISAPCSCGVPGCPCWELHGFYALSGRLVGFLPEELEPILDPGREVISWEAMAGLWTPAGVPA